jgi:2-dehydro-3-deoxyphosphogluconate aldolase/(4S)-4-hydroxy-2-oxoglutarate aldolase
VLVVDRVEDGVPLARALLDGGVTVMELTLRTSAALGALRAIRESVPEMLAGVGTILSATQVVEAVEAGGAFGVAPGFNPRVVEAARNSGLPFAPGVATPTDIEAAIEAGCRLLKFFPCEPMGGLPYLKAMAAPYQHLGLGFVPLGGIHAGNMAAYLAEPSVAALGGSWLAPRQLIATGDWQAIRNLAAEATATIASCRPRS